MDLFMNEDGDIAVSSTGDLAMTETTWRDLAQQAYVSIMTSKGDFVLYPNLGADLEQLYGMPQSPATGEFGRQLISDALNQTDRFRGLQYDIKAIPTGFQTIRFDIYVTSTAQNDLVLSIEQNLGVE